MVTPVAKSESAYRGGISWTVFDISKTEFSIRVYNSSTSIDVTTAFEWIAIDI